MEPKGKGWEIKGAHMHQIVSFLSVHTRAKWRCKKARSNFWLQLQHISCSYRHRILDVSCVWICPDTDRSLLSPLHRHLVSPPSVSHVTRQQGIVSCVSAVCNYLHWSEIWPSCPLQFGGKSLISFMRQPGQKENGREGYWSRRNQGSSSAHGRHEEYLKCFRSPVIRVCVQSVVKKYHSSRNVLNGREDEQSLDVAF